MYNRLKQPKKWQRIEIITAFIIIMLTGISLSSCGVQKNINTIERIEYREVVKTKTDTISIEIPKEIIKEVVPQFDTLTMETSLAKSVSYIDTLTHTLKGNLENKYKEKLNKEISYKEKVVYKDSLVYKEIPIEVEKPVKYVPNIFLFLSLIGLVSISFFILKILSKLKL